MYPQYPYAPYAPYSPPSELAFFTIIYFAFAPFLAPLVEAFNNLIGHRLAVWDDAKLPLPVTSRRPRYPLAALLLLVVAVLALTTAIELFYYDAGIGYVHHHHSSAIIDMWD